MSEVTIQGAPHTAETSASTTAATPSEKKKAHGLTFRRLFTKPGVHPYDEIEWELRDATITDSKGGIIFEQKNVEVPKDWSMTATNIVASKYLHGTLGTEEREKGVKQLISRVAETIRRFGMLRPGQKIGVAVSGGADSVCLLQVLRELAPCFEVALSVLHVNHRLRAAESDEDREFVQALAHTGHRQKA